MSHLYTTVNKYLESLTEWFRSNELSLNVGKTHYGLFTHKHIMVPENLNITIGEETIQRKDTVKCLGMYAWRARQQVKTNTQQRADPVTSDHQVMCGSSHPCQVTRLLDLRWI